jgi:hypothetical protein
VHVTLRAAAPTASKVSASVLVLESLGTYNGRVEQPPDRVLLQTVTLDAAPGGGGAREVAVRLPGRRSVGEDLAGSEMNLGHYTIFVMAPKTAVKLDKLLRGAKREGAAAGFDPMEGDSPRHEAFNQLYYSLRFDEPDGEDEEDEEDEAALGAEGRAARLEVLTRPLGSAVAIRAPERAVVGQEVSVVVQVTNPTKRRIADLTVQLQQPPIHEDYLGLDFEQVSLASESASLALGPRETKQVEFRLTAKQVGTLGLYASISCDECDYDARLHDGNLEAIEIAPAPAPAPEAASPAISASR